MTDLKNPSSFKVKEIVNVIIYLLMSFQSSLTFFFSVLFHAQAVYTDHVSSKKENMAP